MSEDEKDTLVSKRKYWAKVIKNNVKYTIVCVIYIIYCMLIYFPRFNFEEQTNIDVVLVLTFYLSLFFLLGSWPLSLIMYGYQSFKINKMTNSQPEVISKPQGMTAAQIIAIKEAKELLDKKIITKLEFDKIKNEYADEEVVTRLRGITDLRDSGVLTESEFQEQKSRILNETTSQTNEKLSFNNYMDLSNLSLGKAVVVGGVVGIIILILIISVFGFFNGNSNSNAFVEYSMGCWSGAFHNGESIISISGCGDESFRCSDRDSCSISAQKQEDNGYELCVKIGSKKACTTAGYGVASV